MERIKSLHVSTTQGYAGALHKNSQHLFAYDASALIPPKPELAISLTMPLRPEPWAATPLLPAFQTFLPEGFLRDRIRQMFGKTMRVDDMALLALSGGNAIGRIRVATTRDAPAARGAVESLAEILADNGTRDLFGYLCDKYLISTSIAGVQPKVVVPVEASTPRLDDKLGIGERSTLRVRQLIVKTDGPDYPGLSENEYHCLSIAALCGGLLEVPPFSLSQDRRRLAIDRFDLDGEGRYLGFEDMVSLQGKVNDDKYRGSYEQVAATIRDNCSPRTLQSSLERFFASVVLSVVLRNGDAHLKNFGLLYTHPETDDCRLSPVFDQVCTTVYIPKDVMALSMANSRSWPERKTLEWFGSAHCDVGKPGAILDRVISAADQYRPSAEGPAWARVKEVVDASVRYLAMPEGSTPKRSHARRK